MLFAQSGVDPSTVPSSTLNTAILWLIPIALVSAGLAFFLRNQVRKSDSELKLQRQLASKPPAGKKSSRSVESSEATESLSPSSKADGRNESSQKKGKKNSKKSKQLKGSNSNNSVGVGKIASVKSAPEPSLSSSPVTAKQEVNVPAEVAQTDPSKVPITSPAPVPAPINAIFEPLREVSQRRRKQAEPIENESNEYVVSEPLNPMAGGKFERIVPKIDLRSASNRWPVSSMQQVKAPIAAPHRSEPVASIPAASTVAAIPTEPTPPPAKGLKSFVSKVKGTVSDSQ